MYKWKIRTKRGKKPPKNKSCSSLAQIAGLSVFASQLPHAAHHLQTFELAERDQHAADSDLQRPFNSAAAATQGEAVLPSVRSASTLTRCDWRMTEGWRLVSLHPVGCQSLPSADHGGTSEGITPGRCYATKMSRGGRLKCEDAWWTNFSLVGCVCVCVFVLLSLLLHNLAERPIYSCYRHTLHPLFITLPVFHNSNTPETLKASLRMCVRRPCTGRY